MASIRKRLDKWQVQIRRTGYPSISRTFQRKSDALTWARHMEAEADRVGLPHDRTALKKLSVADLIARYRDTVTVKKRGAIVERDRLNVMLMHRFTRAKLVDATPALFGAYRDERLARLKCETVRRELGLLQRIFTVAMREWGVPLNENPLAAVTKPPTDKPRDRRLMPGEYARLLNAAQRGRNRLVKPLVELAIETGMRRGELLNIHWADVNLERATLYIPETKNGHPRTIPLSPAAISILHSLSTRCEGRAFPLTIDAVKHAWRRLRTRAGIHDLHFHDLRHEAISRFFERGLSVPEVALISGHRDYRQLLRYTHLRPEDIAMKLAVE